LFHLDFYGSPFDESYWDLLEMLGVPAVAERLRAVWLRGPDEGANGTRNWDLEPLVAGPVLFPNLELFSIELTVPAHHNRTIVAAVYEENGVLARLLASSPRLRSLTVPSAPDATFFETAPRPLSFLSVDAGYDTQQFARRLSRSSCFPDLYCLEWGEYNETYLDDWQSRCTPLEDYRELFQSAAFSGVKRFVWRNPLLTNDEIRQLKSDRRDLQLLVVRTSSEYVA
jgi:hypothetical protein